MMNESFKFYAFWGIIIILNEVLILFYSILFKIFNIRAGCYKIHGVGCDELNSINLLVRSHGGTTCDGRNSMNILVRFHGGAIVYIIR